MQRYEGKSDDEVKFRCPCVNYLNGRKLNAIKLGNILFVMVSLEVIQYEHGIVN